MHRASNSRTQTPAVVGFVLFWAATCVNAPGGWYVWVQHVPTAVFAGVIVWLVRAGRVGGGTLALLLAFWSLHCVGARWIYSYVPYDAALRSLFGTDTGDWFGWTRNHYDRLVHTMYGVCHSPIAAAVHRRAGRSRWASAALAVEFVLASSAVYELAEWGAAVVMAPDWADSYLGQQGDEWDAQKDVAVAGLGAVVAAGVWAWLDERRFRAPR